MIKNEEIYETPSFNSLDFDSRLTPSEFSSILKEDWTKSTLISQIKILSNLVSIYQVLNCFDVSVPKYKVDECEYDDGDPEDDDLEQIRYRGYKPMKSSRMLKLVLFDGKNNRIAFEYEPIGAFDVFFDPDSNTMSRCSVKIGLYNSPVCRRNTLWLTNSNVKLLFEGFSCKLFSPQETVSQNDENNINFESEFEVTSEIMELANKYHDSQHEEELKSPTPMSSLKKVQKLEQLEMPIQHTNFGKTSSLSKNDDSYELKGQDRVLNLSEVRNLDELDKSYDKKNPLKLRSSEKPRGTDVTPSKIIYNFNDYFPPDSIYANHSFLGFIRKFKLPFNNSTFLRYSMERFLDKFGDSEINLENFSKILNFSISKQELEVNVSYSEGPYQYYKFGYLNHSSVANSVEGSTYSDILSIIIQELFGSLEKRVWFSIFDDCISLSFCLFDLDTFPFLTPFPEELRVSLEINSLEGFFLLEKHSVEGFNFMVLKDFLRNLPYNEVRNRIDDIENEFLKIKSQFDY